jgi:hypothetical protein
VPELRDQAGRVLLVEPSYKPNFDIPGDARAGAAHRLIGRWAVPRRWHGYAVDGADSGLALQPPSVIMFGSSSILCCGRNTRPMPDERGPLNPDP